MTENPPPPRGDSPKSGDDYPPYPEGSGGEQGQGDQPPFSQSPSGGQYGPPPQGGQQQGPPGGGQYGPPPSGGQQGPPGGQYGPPPSGGQQGPPGGQYGPPPSGGQYGSPGGGQYGPPGGGRYDSPPGGEQYGSPGGGQYGPPPGGGYGPPPNYGSPQGGYPPPPGFGNDPYPSAGGYGAGDFGAPQLTVGDALSYGWAKFKNNALVWIGIALIALVISIAVRLPFGTFNYDTNDLQGSFGLWNIIGSVVGLIVGYLIQAAFVRGSLHEVDGNRPAIGSFFQFNNIGAVILASILVGIATTIGFFLCIIPGFIVMFLTWFTLQFVIDQNQDAITAIKSSYNVISKNVGPLLLLALANVGINIVGALLCGIGLLVTIPVTLIAAAYAYRVLVHGPVSAPTA